VTWRAVGEGREGGKGLTAEEGRSGLKWGSRNGNKGVGRKVSRVSEGVKGGEGEKGGIS